MNKIYVGNLSYQLTEGDLQAAFSKFGPIEQVTLISDRYTGESKGFAFVTFATAGAAQEALSLDGTELSGRKIRVNEAREKTSTGGGSRSGSGDRGPRSGNREGNY